MGTILFFIGIFGMIVVVNKLMNPAQLKKQVVRVKPMVKYEDYIFDGDDIVYRKKIDIRQ